MQGQTQPAGCGFREETGGALRTSGSHRLWGPPVCTLLSSSGLKGTDRLYCPLSPDSLNCTIALRPENGGQELLILEGVRESSAGGTVGKFSTGEARGHLRKDEGRGAQWALRLLVT